MQGVRHEGKKEGRGRRLQQHSFTEQRISGLVKLKFADSAKASGDEETRSKSITLATREERKSLAAEAMAVHPVGVGRTKRRVDERSSGCNTMTTRTSNPTTMGTGKVPEEKRELEAVHSILVRLQLPPHLGPCLLHRPAVVPVAAG